MNPGDTFVLGKYTVRLGLRRDNPAFPIFLVYLGHVLIGKSFSRVDEDACRWLERQQREQTFYAYSSAPLPDHSGHKRSRVFIEYPSPKPVKRARGAPKKPETLLDIAKALAGA